MDTDEDDKYCYDKDGNFYIIKNETQLKKITKQEYLTATNESLFIFDKLKNSLYPDQKSGFCFFKNP
jgi:hypothetical protein